MGCGSSKEIDPQEEKVIVRRDSPPVYTEKQGHGQMQVRVPQQVCNDKQSAGCAPATMSNKWHPGKVEFDDFCEQQAQHAQWSPPPTQHKHPATVAFDAFSAEQAQSTHYPPARELTQYKSKGRREIRVPARPPYDTKSSRYHCPPTRGVASNKAQLGYAAPARGPQCAAIRK